MKVLVFKTMAIYQLYALHTGQQSVFSQLSTSEKKTPNWLRYLDVRSESEVYVNMSSFVRVDSIWQLNTKLERSYFILL